MKARLLPLIIIPILFVIGILLFVFYEKPDENLSANELLDLGEKYMLDMNYEQAAVCFDKLIEVEPHNPRGYTELASAQIGLENYDDATETLNSGFEQLADDSDFLTDATELYEDLLEEDPKNPDCYIGLADVYVAQDNDEKAIEVLEYGLEQVTDNVTLEAKLEKLTASSKEGLAQTPIPASEPENLIDSLDDSDYEKLSIFFSNFSEVSFGDFDAEHYSNEQLIDFAVWHKYVNNSNDVIFESEIDFYSAKISAEAIENAISRYFDIQVQHQSCGYINDPDHINYGQYLYLYKDGYYYFMPADGEALTWSEVVEFYDNGDGTFSAVTHEYSSHEITNQYQRKENWVYNADVFWDDNQYHYATVEPYSYNGKESYKLLKWTTKGE